MASSTLYRNALAKFQKEAQVQYTDAKTRGLLVQFLSERGTPEDSRAAAESLGQNTAQKYGDRQVAGDTKISGVWIQNILSNINNFISVGNYAMKGAPESVGLAWFAVKLTLSAIQSNFELYGLFGSGLTDITEIMIIIPHYDRLYDERSKPGWKPSEVVNKLFDDIVNAYTAVLRFAFSVKRHIEGDKLDKLRHGFKDFFGASKSKFDDRIKEIASLKKKVLEDTQAAFEKRSLDSLESLGDITNSMKSTIDDIRDFQPTLLNLQHSQLEIMKGVESRMDDLLHRMKAKTPWDLAVQEFDRIKDRLRVPPNNTSAALQRLLTAKFPDTCRWVLEEGTYREWEISESNSALCLTGAKGSGKSTILATVHEHLSGRSGTDRGAVLYASCELDAGSSKTNKEPPRLATIYNVLILQVLQLAITDAEDASLLESCNKVFDIPKGKSEKDSKVTKPGSQKAEYIPRFEDAIIKLASLLRINIYIVLDAVEKLGDREQRELSGTLKAISETPRYAAAQKVRTIVGCTVSTPFYYEMNGTLIDVNAHHRADMTMKAIDALSGVPGVSEVEMREASNAILERAGHDFGYLVDVAVPFLQEPFSGSLSNRLKGLPDGMKSIFKQALEALPSNKADLLRTAVSWTLFTPPGDNLPTLQEISDAFHGAYENTNQEDRYNSSTTAGFPIATELFRKQIQDVAGPFLTIYNENFVNLQDWEQIPTFCEEAGNDPQEYNEGHSQGQYCDRCRTQLSQHNSLAFKEKDEHLQRALACLRRLNNPLFQRRAGLLEDPAGIEQPEAKPSGTSGDTNANNPDVKAIEVQYISDDNGPALDGELNSVTEPDAKGSSGEATETQAKEEQDSHDDSGYLTDESQDEEDKQEDELGNAIDEYDYIPNRLTNDGTHIRYEIVYWPYHLRQAEELWKPEARVGNAYWTDIITELEALTANRLVFDNWQRDFYAARGGAAAYMCDPRSPLHVASYLGLVTWAEHLIAQGHTVNEISGERTALQVACDKADCRPMLKLLLEHGGDPNFESDDCMPAFHWWLLSDSSLETMQLMLDHGGNPTLVTGQKHGGWNLVHYLAGSGESPEALTLLLDHAPAESRLGLVNDTTPDGVTPLHILLLSRRSVPKPLLKCFLDHGADINKDDDNSSRTLQVACVTGELECVRSIFEFNVEEIDDLDNDGDTALHQACLNGHPKCLDLVAEKGADINLANKLRRTPLHDAAKGGYTECVRILLQRGAIAQCFDIHDRTPFFDACQSESEEAARLILGALIDAEIPISEINKSTKGGRTPLRQASSRGFDGVVGLIIETACHENVARLEIDRQDAKKGMSALHRASMHGHAESARLLLDFGANASLKTNDGKTALVFAYESWSRVPDQPGYEDIISMLIREEPEAAKIDAELHAICAVNGSTRLLKQLHNIGTDLHRQDSYGWTPLELARNADQVEVESFLRKGGLPPSRWMGSDSLLSGDGLTVTVAATGKRFCISADKPLPANIESYYFEVKFLGSTFPTVADGNAASLNSGGDDKVNNSISNTNTSSNQYPIVAIGFCTLSGAPIDFPGWPPRRDAPSVRSWGYHGDDGGFFSSRDGMGASSVLQRTAGPKYGRAGDTVGCGVDVGKRTIWFTHNGKRLAEHEFTDVQGRLFPVLGLEEAVRLETRFKEPFVYKGEAASAGTVGGDGSTSILLFLFTDMLIYCAAVSVVQSLALTRYQQWRLGTVGESPFQTTPVLFFFLAQYTILSIYRAFIYPRFVSPLRHIPGPTGGHFFFGQAINLFKAPTPISLYTEWSRAHPDAPLLRYLGVGGGEVVVLNSPEAFRDVLQTHCYAFTKPDRLRHMTRPFVGKGLGMLEFDEHKAHRRMMNAAFTPENVRRLEPVFQQKACELGDWIGKVIDDAVAADAADCRGGGGIIECTETFNKATMDVICVALFGIDPDNIGRDNSGGADKGQYSFRDAYNTIFAMNTIESLLMLADSFVPLRWLPCEANRKFKTTTTWLNTTLQQLIQERRKAMVSAKSVGGYEDSRDILAHLIEQSLPGGSAEGMEDEYMVGHLLFLLLAGHDTSSNALSWSAHTLATNPDIQDKLHREVSELLSSSKRRTTTPSSSPGISSSSSSPSFAEIDALPYLHNFVREVLRVYPPAAIMFRQAAAAADVTIQGVRIPKGTAIDLVPAVGSMDRAVWGADADAVRPERWSETREDEKGAPSRLAYAYEVFGNGPRVCVGRQFALVEIKTFLFVLVSRFRFVGVEGGFSVANPSFVLRPAGMRVRVEKVKS